MVFQSFAVFSRGSIPVLTICTPIYALIDCSIIPVPVTILYSFDGSLWTSVNRHSILRCCSSGIRTVSKLNIRYFTNVRYRYLVQ